MKRRIIVLLFLFVAFLLASCGADDQSAGSESKNDNQEELPDGIPKDFPFPDSMWNVHVSSGVLQDGQRHTIAFSYTEDPEELYNIMKTYLEEKGCVGEEVSGHYICLEYEGDEHFEGTKINIDDPIATVTLIVPAKK